MAVLALVSIFALNTSALAQQNIIFCTSLDETLNVQDSSRSAPITSVEVHAGNTLLTEGVDYLIVDEKIRIISEEYQNSLLPINVAFQKSPFINPKEPSINPEPIKSKIGQNRE